MIFFYRGRAWDQKINPKKKFKKCREGKRGCIACPKKQSSIYTQKKTALYTHPPKKPSIYTGEAPGLEIGTDRPNTLMVVDAVHAVLGSPARRTRLSMCSDRGLDMDAGCLASPAGAFKVLGMVPRSLLASAQFLLHLQEDLARFFFILVVVIPTLACMFVFVGAVFHVPRMAATFASRLVISYCWGHVVRQARSRCSCEGKGVQEGIRREGCCMLGCCLTCRTAAYMDGGVFKGSFLRPVGCCRCGRSLQE